MRISAVWYLVARWEEAKHFYGGVLGLAQRECSDAAGWAAYATEGGPPLFLVRRPELVGGAGNATVTLETPDLDAFRTQLDRAGIRVESVQEGSTRILTVADPDGNRVEVAQAATV